MAADAHRRDTPPRVNQLEVEGRRADGPRIDALLVAVGRGDLDALAAFYDATAPAVFGLLQHVLGHRVLAEQAATRVYLNLWRTAPAFVPTDRTDRTDRTERADRTGPAERTGRSAYALLLRATRRELVHEILARNRAAGLDDAASSDARSPGSGSPDVGSAGSRVAGSADVGDPSPGERR